MKERYYALRNESTGETVQRRQESKIRKGSKEKTNLEQGGGC